MEQFKRNAVGVILLILVAAAIVAVAVAVAVEKNKPAETTEYFIDSAPIDYNSPDNSVYVKKFTDAVAGYFSNVTTQTDLSLLAERLCNAMSYSRIAAPKLGELATVINNNKIDDPNKIFDDVSIDEEAVVAVFGGSAANIIGSFFNKTFRETGLTSEEVASIIYNYLYLYGSADYKSHLAVAGKERFVNLISFLTYFSSELYAADGGRLSDPAALSAAVYQLGAVLETFHTDAQTTERVLGLRWIYGAARDNAADINVYTVALNNKLGYLVPLAGCVLKELGREDLSITTDLSFDGYVTLARAVKRGLEKFLTDYGEDFGASDCAQLKAQLKGIEYNLYHAMVEVADGDRDELVNLIANSSARLDKFFDALEILCTATGSDAATEAAVQDLSVLDTDANNILTAVLYMWCSCRLDELGN